MRLDSAFSDRLKWAIAAKNTNQAELARAIGISTQAVQQWASGATSNPNREPLLKACQHLGVRYDYLACARGPLTDAQARVAVAGSLLRQLHAVVITRTAWDPAIAAGHHRAGQDQEAAPAA